MKRYKVTVELTTYELLAIGDPDGGKAGRNRAILKLHEEAFEICHEIGWQDESRTYTPAERQLDTRIDCPTGRLVAA